MSYLGDTPHLEKLIGGKVQPTCTRKAGFGGVLAYTRFINDEAGAGDRATPPSAETSSADEDGTTPSTRGTTSTSRTQAVVDEPGERRSAGLSGRRGKHGIGAVARMVAMKAASTMQRRSSTNRSCVQQEPSGRDHERTVGNRRRRSGQTARLAAHPPKPRLCASEELSI